MKVAARLLPGSGFLSCGISGFSPKDQLTPGPNAGFNCCVAGEAIYIDPQRQEHLVTPGLSCFHPPGGKHKIIASSDYQDIYLTCDAGTIDHISKLGLIDPTISLHHHAGRRALNSGLKSFANLCKARASISDCMLSFLRFLQLCAESSAERNRDPMEDIMQRLKSDLDMRLDLKAMAEELGMSYATLHRKVKAATGSAPGDLRLTYRLDRADELLTQQPVQAVSKMLGYPSPADFCRQYKRHRGHSPGSMRKG